MSRRSSAAVTSICTRALRSKPYTQTSSSPRTRSHPIIIQQCRNYTPPALAGTTASEIDSARTYCTTLLQKYDNPSYLLSTFIPASARDAHLALRALNLSLASIADATSNSRVGALRMQFWRDAITSSLNFSPRKEPVALLLSAAAASLATQTDGTARFSKAWLFRLVAEREKYLSNPPYRDLTSLESYAENTYSTLLYLTLSALPLASVNADHLASHVGKAQGIVAVLRGLPLVAFPPAAPHHSNQAAFGGALSVDGPPRQGSVLLPLDVMARAGVREEEVLRRGAEAAGLRDAVFEVATRASDHLITAREMLKSLRAGQGPGHDFEHSDDAEHARPEQALAAGSLEVERIDAAFGVYMPAVATQLWLDRLQKVDFDVFDASLRSSSWRLPWRSYLAYRNKTF